MTSGDTEAGELLGRGRRLEHEGRLAEALALYEQAVATWPGEAAPRAALAMALHDQGRLPEALPTYRQALALDPDNPELRHSYGYALFQTNAPEGALEAYRRALALAPDQPGLRRDLVMALETLGRVSDAVEVLEEALARNPDDLRAHRQLTRLCLRAVPRWHLPMLNDVARNEAYDRAIRQVVRPGDLVLDIGTGSGLLAMIAARAGAQLVVSCEIVAPIVDVARRIVADNGLADIIRIVNKPSTRLRVGDDLPRRADVLVSEIVDAGLLGENMLPVVRHARQQLLVSEARVIPRAASITAVLIESEALVATERVTTAAGFDVSRFNRFAVPGYLPRRLAGHPHRELTQPETIFELDLANPEAAGERRELSWVPVHSGTAHAVAFWFRLELAEGVTLDSGPSGDDGHWVQAVQLLPERPVQAGRAVSLRAAHDGLHVAFFWAEPAGVLG